MAAAAAAAAAAVAVVVAAVVVTTGLFTSRVAEAVAEADVAATR